ncbi:MAG TPA: SDR family oxidoreductase [Nevskiaceae bacterium]|nr:SDR family oxidoreductase [Nevskiaceae bacterium]
MTSAPTIIVGCGDLGRRVALRLPAGTVRAIVRGESSAQALREAAIDARAFDLDATDVPIDAGADVFWFAPPPETGTTDPRLRRWCAARTSAPRRLVYVSTSGVYGDCAGAWIDEDAPLQPRTDRGRRRLDAERALQDLARARGTEVVVLRVPGIYGPGRLPVERLKKGLAVVREEEAPWTNRIHVDDLATVALAAMARGRPGCAYNVSDGHPTTMTDYFVRCARLLGLPEPPRVTLEIARASFTPAMRSFLEESKRLVNRRMLDELGITLRYPSLEHGLPACLEGAATTVIRPA